MLRLTIDEASLAARRVLRCILGISVLLGACGALCSGLGVVESGPLLYLAWSASGEVGLIFCVFQIFLALTLISGHWSLSVTICLALTNAVVLVGSGAPADVASLRITQCLLVAEGLLLLLIIYDEKSTRHRW